MKKFPYFEGWYLKQQGERGSFAVIPSFHIDEKGNRSAWIQVITDCGAYSFSFPAKAYSRSRKQFQIKIGNNVFSRNGILLNLEQEGVSIHGKLHFGRFIPPAGDLMGPFRFLPMECSHGVESFYHRVDGTIVINHRVLSFQNGSGYIERDLGHSFPEKYGWTHTALKSAGNCIMAAAAKIPLGRGFWGCLAVVRLNGREYRLATYRGARVAVCEDGYMLLKQGRSWLEVRKVSEDTTEGKKGAGQQLQAPKGGSMKRKVEEVLSTQVHYRFYWKGKCMLDRVVEESSIEFGG